MFALASQRQLQVARLLAEVDITFDNRDYKQKIHQRFPAISSANHGLGLLHQYNKCLVLA